MTEVSEERPKSAKKNAKKKDDDVKEAVEDKESPAKEKKAADGEKKEKKKGEGESKAKPEAAGSSKFCIFVLFIALACAVWVALPLLGGSNPAAPAEVQQWAQSGRRIPINDGQGRRLRVFVRSQGPRGGEAVVMLHGFGASSYSYRVVGEELGKAGMYAVAIDLPGFGLSDKPVDAPYTIQWMTACLTDAINALGLESVHIIAHEFSSVLVQQWSEKHPGRLISLTLLNPTLKAKEVSLPTMLGLVANFPPLHIPALLIASHPLFSPLSLLLARESLFTSASLSTIRAHSSLVLEGGGAKVMGKMAANLLNVRDQHAGVGGLGEVASLVFWSDGGLLGSAEQRQELRRHLLGLEETVPVLARHWIQEDTPIRIATKVREMISRHETPAEEKARAAAKRGGGGGESAGHGHSHHHHNHHHAHSAHGGGGGCSHAHGAGGAHSHDHAHHHHAPAPAPKTAEHVHGPGCSHGHDHSAHSHDHSAHAHAHTHTHHHNSHARQADQSSASDAPKGEHVHGPTCSHAH